MIRMPIKLYIKTSTRILSRNIKLMKANAQFIFKTFKCCQSISKPIRLSIFVVVVNVVIFIMLNKLLIFQNMI